TILNQEPESDAASARAIRSASPTLRIAVPITKPPSTSQNASDWKPENTTSAGAARKTVIAAKNNSAVKYSGSALVAHNRMAMPANQPGWINHAVADSFMAGDQRVKTTESLGNICLPCCANQFLVLAAAVMRITDGSICHADQPCSPGSVKTAQGEAMPR